MTKPANKQRFLRMALDRAAALLAATAFMLIAGSPLRAQPVELPTPGAAAPVLSDADAARLLAEPGPMGERVMGKANAPVIVIEYASLGCVLCRAFHKATFPQFKKTYIDTGKVRYSYREFPIGKSSAAAAVALRCVPEKHYFRLADKFMSNPGPWNSREVNADAIYKVVQETGLKRAEFDTCLTNQKISDGVTWTKQRGRELGVRGTPTFFINGQKVRGALSFEEMRKLIEQHLHGAANPA
jgi:protein-disulfide isomerase